MEPLDPLQVISNVRDNVLAGQHDLLGLYTEMVLLSENARTHTYFHPIPFSERALAELLCVDRKTLSRRIDKLKNLKVISVKKSGPMNQNSYEFDFDYKGSNVVRLGYNVMLKGTELEKLSVSQVLSTDVGNVINSHEGGGGDMTHHTNQSGGNLTHFSGPSGSEVPQSGSNATQSGSNVRPIAIDSYRNSNRALDKVTEFVETLAEKKKKENDRDRIFSRLANHRHSAQALKLADKLVPMGWKDLDKVILEQFGCEWVSESEIIEFLTWIVFKEYKWVNKGGRFRTTMKDRRVYHQFKMQGLLGEVHDTFLKTMAQIKDGSRFRLTTAPEGQSVRATIRTSDDGQRFMETDVGKKRFFMSCREEYMVWEKLPKSA